MREGEGGGRVCNRLAGCRGSQRCRQPAVPPASKPSARHFQHPQPSTCRLVAMRNVTWSPGRRLPLPCCTSCCMKGRRAGAGARPGGRPGTSGWVMPGGVYSSRPLVAPYCKGGGVGRSRQRLLTKRAAANSSATHPGDRHAARLPAQAAKCGPVRGHPSVHIPKHASWMQNKWSAHEMAEGRTCLPMVGRSSTTPRTSSSPTTSNTTEPGGARRICRQG